MDYILSLLFVILLPIIARTLGVMVPESWYRPAIVVLWMAFVVVIVWGLQKRGGRPITSGDYL